MTKLNPDYSFEREGIPLSEWLWRLLDEDREKRNHAGNVLQAMSQGVPNFPIDWRELESFPELLQQREAFAGAVQKLVETNEFRDGMFVPRLCAYKIATATDWYSRVAAKSLLDQELELKFDRISKKLQAVIDSHSSPEVRDRAATRLERTFDAYLSSESKVDLLAGAESYSPASIAAGQVYAALNDELMRHPGSLQSMLDTPGTRHAALDALKRIGIKAISFAESLIGEIDQLPAKRNNFTSMPHFDGSDALAAIGKGSAEVVSLLVERLGHADECVRLAVTVTLEAMDGEVAGFEQVIVDRLAPKLEREEELYASIAAIASAGRHFREVRRTVLELAKVKPPDIRSAPGYPEYPYDHAMQMRGMAISAIGYFKDYPEECIPVLIAAMDDFVEYDPDETYEGPIGRVSGVLAQFKSKAKDAAVPLASHLDDEPKDSRTAILRALAAIGPAARDALPLLIAYRTRRADRGELLPDLSMVQVEEYEDNVGWAIQRIQGFPPSNG